jgi:hypothetical protein
MKLTITCGAVGFVEHRLHRLGVDRRAVDAEALAEGAHPVILIELLAPGQRAPRDQLVDVGVAGVVADVLAFQPRPGGRGDDLARLGLNVAEADLLVFLGKRQMGVIAAGLLAQRRPGLDRDLAIGFGRKHQDHFGGIDRGFDLRHALARPVLLHRAVELAQRFDLVIGVPADALAAIAELVHQRAERGEAVVECWGSRARPRDIGMVLPGSARLPFFQSATS